MRGVLIAVAISGAVAACTLGDPFGAAVERVDAGPPNGADGYADADANGEAKGDASTAEDAASATDAGPDAAPSCPKRADPTTPAPFLAPPADVNGSRIHAKYMNGLDGSRHFLNLEDEGIGDECLLQIRSSGEKCFQLDQPKSRLYWPSRAFSDAGCTKLVFGIPHGAPPFARAGTRRLALYEQWGTGCRAKASDYSHDYYDAPAAVPETSLVTFVQSAPTGAPGEAIVDKGSDGTSIWRGRVAAYGVEGARFVNPYVAGSTGHIVPARVAYPEGTTSPNPSCSSTLDVFFVDGPVNNGTLVSDYGKPAVTRAITGQSYVRVSVAEGCNLSPSTADAFHVRLDPCDVSEFTTLTAVKAGQRLTFPGVVVGPNAVPYPEDELVAVIKDEQLATGCGPAFATDGVLRCMPNDENLVSAYYSDPSCSSPLIEWTWGFTPSASSRAARWIDGKLAIHPIGDEVATSALYWSDGGACTEVPRGSSPVRALGPETPPSTFVEVTIGD